MSDFEDFVNVELPKRIATNQNPLSVPADMVWVTTGVGLMVELRPYGADPATKDYTATLDVRAHHVVVGQAGDGVRELDITDNSHGISILGIATQAALTGETTKVQSSGYMTEAGWSWTPEEPIYAGAEGLLTQTLPAGNYVVIVALALSATEINVSIQTPIYGS